MSLHPPSLANEEDSVLPASLIPICLYQSNSSKLGRWHDELNFTMCNSFEHTLHKGQHCYSLHLNDSILGDTKLGKSNGLILVIDPQLEESDVIETQGQNLIEDNRFATISLDTLAPFSDSVTEDGDYALTALKWMTGTETFMELSNEEKKCQKESFNECQTRKIIQHCRCLSAHPMFSKTQKVQVISGNPSITT